MKKKTRADYYKENPESYAKKKKYDSKLGKREEEDLGQWRWLRRSA